MTLVQAREQTYEQAIVPGRPMFTPSEGEIQPSTQAEIDEALDVLSAHKDEWVTLDIQERIDILDEITRDVETVSERWVKALMQAQDLKPGSYGEGEKWADISMVFHLVRLLRHSLEDIQRDGKPRIPGSVKTRPNGQVVAQVFPQFWYDRLTMMGVKAEVWMEPDIPDLEEAISQASFYRDQTKQGKVTLVLGAGNVSALIPADFLHKLFVERQVVVLKPNPVNAYLGPLIEEGFQALTRRGYLRVVYGGAVQGDYLVQHPAVNQIHMTGSDKTFEAIVFGPGEEGAQRKAQRKPKITKRVTAELGNVSPVIVVPGPWTDSDIQAQAGKLGTWLAINAGYGCLTPRMIINWQAWEQRDKLNQAVGDFLSQVETRRAYYPGAKELHDDFVSQHPEARQVGGAPTGHLPWTLIPDVDPNNEEEICFNTEAFCSLFSETALQADSVEEFIDKAVDFANERLWGTLVATIIVHPKSMKDPKIASAVDRAIEKLRYGSVAVNQWSVIAYMLMLTPWGGCRGQDIYDIQSGTGVVNNALMFDHPQKSVVYGPFIQSPDPFLATTRNAHEFGRRLADFERSTSIPNLIRLFQAVMKS